MRPRKVPLRKCVACQEMMSKKELIRVVRTPNDEVLIDLSGKKSGRGAYLCGKVTCFKLAKKSKALDRALKQPVGEEIYDQLEQDFIKLEDEFIANKELTIE
ncbi:RNase P modulator RnpM [Paenibacillus endoradicis]|uniref:YlxR family protein n=1 Tax=Candidatus Pristimantibacillus lignocellulolyticus TaxID=2994561 RepID=A0A9J6ZC85_9BACL|nr:YlxR family protein [Paenibacillus endoradicis]MCR8656295.1 YlxR family protein [Paenibacillus endoradicis]URN93449.1 MAG: YlxR family protein [Candidatus Pristimantibacillus lignocellulolyticus]